MANLQNFDARNVKPAEELGVIPSGDYTAMIVASEMKETNKKDGQYLECEYQIIDGPLKDRKLWSWHNLDNPNPKASEIAQRELSAICHAVGVLVVADSTQLHNKPLTVRVEVEPAGTKRKDGSVTAKDRNNVTGWKATGGAALVDTTSAAGGPSTTPITSPWNQKAA